MTHPCLRGETIHPNVSAADTGLIYSPREFACSQLVFEKALLVFRCLFPSRLALLERFSLSRQWFLVSFESCRGKD